MKTKPQAWASALLRDGIAPDTVRGLFSHGIVSPRHLVALTSPEKRARALAAQLRVSMQELLKIRECTISHCPASAQPAALHFGERFASGLMPSPPEAALGESSIRAALLRHFRETDDGRTDDGPVDHRDKCDPVGDQLDIGSCWVWGTLTMVSVVLCLAHGERHERLSPKFLFQDIKGNGKDPFPDTDGGRPEYACRALLDVGACTDRTYPYEKPIERSTVPPSRCYEEAGALNLPLQEFIELSADSGADAELIDSVLRGTPDFTGRALTAGLPIYPSFFETDESGYVMDPTDEEKEWGPAGYHLMALVGTFVLEVDCGQTTVRTRYYVLRNSWGVGFGDAGDVYVSERYLVPMLMCCVTMFHGGELRAWRQSRAFGVATSKSAPACRGKQPADVLAGMVAVAVVLACLSLLAFEPWPAFVRRALPGPDTTATETRQAAPAGFPSRQGYPRHALAAEHSSDPEGRIRVPDDAPTWDELRRRIRELLED